MVRVSTSTDEVLADNSALDSLFRIVQTNANSSIAISNLTNESEEMFGTY